MASVVARARQLEISSLKLIGSLFAPALALVPPGSHPAGRPLSGYSRALAMEEGEDEESRKAFDCYGYRPTGERYRPGDADAGLAPKWTLITRVALTLWRKLSGPRTWRATPMTHG